ncbi:MAG: heme exporter protein CcmB [Acidimicrobiia bacterium]|nr:MAG: heme exporter protein CcmB [Acidimicrobiia bacterium]
MIRHALTLFRFQLVEERRSGEVAMVLTPFGAVALLVVPMAVGIDTPLLDRIGPGLFWAVVLLFGTLVTQRQSAFPDRARRDALTLLGVDPAARFAASAAAAAILLLAFEVAMGVVTVFLYDPKVTGWWWMVLLLPLVAGGLGLLGTLAGSVATGFRGGTLAPLLVVPLAVPMLLGAARATEGLQSGDGILRWILLLALMDLILALAGVLTARPLEES